VPKRTRRSERIRQREEPSSIRLWITKEQGLSEGDIGEHLRTKGYAIVEGPDTDGARRSMQRLRKDTNKELRKGNRTGWETGLYGFKTAESGEAAEAAVRNCREGGAGQEAIRGMEKAIRKALRKGGRIEQAWMVTWGTNTTG
jgi:hypothetical protein